MRPVSLISSVALIGGGGLMAVLLVAMTLAPQAPLLPAFLVIAPAIGVGSLAAASTSAGRIARIGRGSAWLAAAGGVAVALVGVYAIVTARFSAAAGLAGDDPMAIPFMLTSMAWMVGSLGLALSLVLERPRASAGPWLLLIGSLSAIVLGSILAAIAPELAALSALPFALGWMVVGGSLRMTAAVPLRP
jgi:hypothetical protein